MASEHELTRERNERFLGLLQPVYADCQRWAFSLTRNSEVAGDVLQQSILVGLENVHQLKNDGAFKTWMFRIIRNTHLLMIRASKRQADPVDPEGLSGLPGNEDNLEQTDERSKVVARTLEQLSPEQAQGLVLFEMEELSIREVAEVMGKSESAIRVLLHRARQRFKGIYEKTEGAEI